MPHVATIALDQPFVDVLARYLLKRAGADPLALARTQVLLPTRRACNALREALLRESAGAALLLPQLRPLGETEEDELQISAPHDLLPAMPKPWRRLRFARLLMEEDAQVPLMERGGLSWPHALRLADEMLRFIDDIHHEQRDIAGLKTLVPLELAQHWQVTLNLLERVLACWPLVVAASGMMEPVARRNQLLALQMAAWEKNPPAHPVIAAGAVGNIPATASLLRAVSHLPHGMVILPGLDVDMPDAAWDAMDETHPQFLLRHTLAALECDRRAVEVLEGATPSARADVFRQVMAPAEATDGWAHAAVDMAAATRDMHCLTARTEGEESQVIALALRETLETPGKTAALVTRDRTLARRVAACMQVFGVMVDDSAGRPLLDVPEAIFLRLIWQVATEDSPLALLALLKHPMAACGMPTADCRRLVRAVERAALRGFYADNSLAAIAGRVGLSSSVTLNSFQGPSFNHSNEHLAAWMLKQVQHDTISNLRHLPPRQGFGGQAAPRNDEYPPGEANLLSAVIESLRPLHALCAQDAPSFADLLRAHLMAAEALATTDTEPGAERLWRSDAAQALRLACEKVLAAADALTALPSDAYGPVLEQLLSAESFRPRYGTHPRLHILSPLEARLQHFDRMILGGLNEENWPQMPVTDPWMSRPMRVSFGLPAPELAVGQAAHDFLMLAHGEEILFTRSEKKSGSPTTPARWLERLKTFVGGRDAAVWTRMTDAPYLHWARNMRVTPRATPITRPAPCPPLLARPRQFSVTGFDRLVRDPYGIYAKQILCLKKLRDIGEEPGAAQVGEMIHRIMEKFTHDCPAALPPDARSIWWAHAETCLRETFGASAIAAYYRPRLAFLMEWVLAQETTRRQDILHILPEQEVSATWALPAGPVTLSARMDRVEIYADGGFAIVDYKTGAVPSGKDVENGFAWQLPLAALLVQKTGLAELPQGCAVAALEYWKLGGAEGGKITPIKPKNADMQAFLAQTEEKMLTRLAWYDDPHSPYYSIPHAAKAPKYNDYAHLARIAEWG